MKTRTQKVLDWFYNRRRWVMTTLAYLSLRLYGTEITKEKVDKSDFGERVYTPLDLKKNKGILDLLLTESERSLDEADKRHDRVLDKAKTLLTLASLLIGLVGALLYKASVLPLWIRIFFFISMMCLLNAVVLVCFILDVRAWMAVTIDQGDADLEREDFKRSLINSYRQSQTARENLNDGLVDIYKAARFFFLTAFALLVFEFSVSFFLVDPDSLAKETAADLRADQKFLDSVRGDKGDPGKEGPPGPKGDQGHQGDQEPKGDCGDAGGRTTPTPRP